MLMTHSDLASSTAWKVANSGEAGFDMGQTAGIDWITQIEQL